MQALNQYACNTALVEFHIYAHGRKTHIAWTLVPGLPIDVGLSFNNGVISGTPVKAQTVTGLVVRATDNAANTVASAPFSIAISLPLALAGAPSSAATVGVGYTAVFTTSGGAGGNIWSTNKALPDGLSISNGAITGTPSKADTWSNIVVRVTDVNGRTAESAPFSIVVSNQMSLTGSLSGSAKVGEPFAATLYANGGRGPYNWTITSGSLPDGLSLAGGIVSGTPSAASTRSFTVRATDQDSRTAESGAFSIDVISPLKREPAVGEYYDMDGYDYETNTPLPMRYWIDFPGVSTQVLWGKDNVWDINGFVEFPSGIDRVSYGGATYYRGSLMLVAYYTEDGVTGNHYIYSLYRTIP
jgi:hypothetical protein